MDGHQLGSAGEKFRRSKTRVKTGCGTCKIRRVKCDEGRPACHRCVSTGRLCDGYGIWGGGGNTNDRKSSGPAQRNAIARYGVTASIGGVSGEEWSYFEWFVRRTTKKLPGTFCSTFWDTLIIQASSNEPAVLHATLALGSAHKRELMDSSYVGRAESGQNELEHFTLRHYNQAISYIRPYLSANTKASVRLVLITCMVFTCLEFLRGHYNTGYTHLQNGLKLLREVITQRSPHESADDCIVEAFERLNVQTALFRYGSTYSYICRQHSGLEGSSLTFRCIRQARQQLDRLLDGILHLSVQFRRRAISQDVVYPPGLLDCQRDIQKELSSWLQAYTASKNNLEVARMSLQDTIAYQTLYIYYIMARIMANTCLRPLDESVFDSYTHDFASAIVQTKEVLKLALPNTKADISEHRTKKFSFTVEMGVIPPLYFTALKCRAPQIRLQAVELLVATSHQEGIWDGKLAASVAQEVIKIEEQEFYKGICREQDLSFLVLPESHRAQVQVKLPDSPMGKVLLKCRRRHNDGSWEILEREFLYVPGVGYKKS